MRNDCCKLKIVAVVIKVFCNNQWLLWINKLPRIITVSAFKILPSNVKVGTQIYYNLWVKQLLTEIKVLCLTINMFKNHFTLKNCSTLLLIENIWKYQKYHARSYKNKYKIYEDSIKNIIHNDMTVNIKHMKKSKISNNLIFCR